MRAELEAALRDHPMDVEAALADLGLLDAADGAPRLAFRHSHGAHVLDLAAGADAGEASANHRIVAVQLPALATSETSGAVTGYFAMHALDHILACVRRIGAVIGTPPPVVVNFSYGFSGGPHDGGGLMEQAIEALTHGDGDAARGAIIARASIDRGDVPGGGPDVGRRRLLIATAPTEIAAGLTRDPAPAGLWQVEVTAPLAAGRSMHAWIQRDDPPRGYRNRGRQSYFDDPGYERFDALGGALDVDPDAACVVRRAGSISGMATGPGTVVVGAVRGPTGDELPSPYSASAISAVAAWPGAAHRPAGAARGDASRALPGILGAGARSGVRVAMNGSSVAAPQVSREIARRLLAEQAPQVQTLFWAPTRGVDADREGGGRLAVDPALRFQVERDAPD